MAAKAANQQDQLHSPPMGGKIGWPALIPTVDMARDRATARTCRRGIGGASVDPDRIAGKLNLIGLEPCWQKTLPRKP